MNGAMPPPPAMGKRLEWDDLPERVRAEIQRRLGGPVVDAVTQPAGFSPGVAARLRTTSGERVFIKAVSAAQNPDAPVIHRREARIVPALPANAPVPRLLWSHDEGGEGWVALAFEDIEGRPPAMPWRADELDRVLVALADLTAALTPSPLPLALAPSASESRVFASQWWTRLRDAPPPGLDDWSTRHAARLAAIETEAPVAVAGESLLHLDIRADNLLLTPERVLVVDWPHARRGAAWLDLVCFAPSVAMQGGPPPEELTRRHPACRAADVDALNAAIVAVAGFFTWGALQPPPPGLPTLRAFVAAQGEVARRWAARRLGLD